MSPCHKSNKTGALHWECHEYCKKLTTYTILMKLAVRVSEKNVQNLNSLIKIYEENVNYKKIIAAIRRLAIKSIIGFQYTISYLRHAVLCDMSHSCTNCREEFLGLSCILARIPLQVPLM